MLNKIICFLDFDGVTHPHPAQNNFFREENLLPLAQCLEQYKVLIVIASTWRFDLSLDDIKEKLKLVKNEVIGITPEINDPFRHYIRQAEAELYLKQTAQEDTFWFAIDDTAAFYKPDARLILTDKNTGFTVSDCDKIKSLIK